MMLEHSVDLALKDSFLGKLRQVALIEKADLTGLVARRGFTAC